MTMGVFDFKSIRRSLERQEQKAEFEEKNPKPSAVVWTPEWGYGMIPVPYAEAASYSREMAQALLDEAYKRTFPMFVVGDETGG